MFEVLVGVCCFVWDLELAGLGVLVVFVVCDLGVVSVMVWVFWIYNWLILRGCSLALCGCFGVAVVGLVWKFGLRF